MAGKISEYANAVATFADGDLVDVSKRLSTSPDVFESQKLEFAQFQAFIQANASNILNTNGLTLGGMYSHNLNSNYLTFTNGTLNISQGSLLVQAETNLGSTAVLFKKQNGDTMFNFLDNGNVIIGGNSTIDLGSNVLTFDGQTAIKGIGTSGSSALTIYDNDTTPNKLWDFLDNGNVNLGGDSVVNISNTLKIEGGQTYIDSGGFNPLIINRKGSGALGNGIDFNAYNSLNAETNFARIVQVATDITFGSEDGGLWLRTVINGSLRTPVILDNREFLIDAQYFTDNNFRVKDGTTDCLKVTTSKQTYVESGGFNPLVLYTASNSPALGTGLDFNQLNSVNAEHNYGRIVSVITDSTNGSEDGNLLLRVSDNGSISTKMTLKTNTVNMPNLPTSATGLVTGDLWNDGGTLKIA